MVERAVFPLGILSLERGEKLGAMQPNPAPGSLRAPSTFAFPTLFEIVPGAWVDNVVPGDPALERPYVEAAQRLVERGAVAISSNCGFSFRHQTAVSAATSVPVVLSSLLLLPLLLRQLPPLAKIAIVTYDSAHCDDDLLGIHGSAERDRIVIGGIEGCEYWLNERKRPVPATAIASIERDVAALVAGLRDQHPEIAAILFECAGLTPVAPAIRRLIGLPVYDITDLCRITMAALPTRQDAIAS